MAKRKPTPVQASLPPIPLEGSVAEEHPKSLVFISHDSRDGHLAEAFSNLLSDVSGGTLKSFRSSDRKGAGGIEFGAEWYQTIMNKLGDATDVVALLTKRSLVRPWILYEAGVAKGKLDTTVFGIAIGVPLEQVSTGPFGQFQNCGDDEDSLTKLVLQLIKRNPDANPREEAVRRQVKAFLEDIVKLLKDEAKENNPKPDADENNIAKLFEEVKAMVHQLPDKVGERLRNTERRPSRGLRRFHPRFLEDALFNPAIRELPGGQAAGWLMFISMLREDLPWLYEPGLDLYKALRSGNIARIAKAKETFLVFFYASMHGPWVHEGILQKGDSYILRELPRMIEVFLNRIEVAPKGSTRTRKPRQPTKGSA